MPDRVTDRLIRVHKANERKKRARTPAERRQAQADLDEAKTRAYMAVRQTPRATMKDDGTLNDFDDVILTTEGYRRRSRKKNRG